MPPRAVSLGERVDVGGAAAVPGRRVGQGVALHHARRGRQSSATQLREIAADQAVSKPSAAADPGKLVVAASAPRTRRYPIFDPDLHRRACTGSASPTSSVPHGVRHRFLGTAVGGSACHAELSRGTTWLVMPIHHFDGAARRPELAPALRTLLLPAHTGLAAARSTRQDPGSRHLRPVRSLGPHSGSADGIHCLSP